MPDQIKSWPGEESQFSYLNGVMTALSRNQQPGEKECRLWVGHQFEARLIEFGKVITDFGSKLNLCFTYCSETCLV